MEVMNKCGNVVMYYKNGHTFYETASNCLEQIPHCEAIFMAGDT